MLSQSWRQPPVNFRDLLKRGCETSSKARVVVSSQKVGRPFQAFRGKLNVPLRLVDAVKDSGVGTTAGGRSTMWKMGHREEDAK
eukprot:5947542-Pyramimonas_sp.AAC.1